MILKKMGRPEIKTLFIGGGTPSSIPLDLLEKFLSILERIVHTSPLEFTIELNPETVNKGLLRILSVNGINRISVGVQSLDDRILRILGRNTDVTSTIKALEIIRKYWPGSFSVDLINAVPGQSVNSALSDIKFINEFEPDHISMYSLTFEPSTKLYTMLKAGKVKIPEESVDSIMQHESIELLKSFGYKRYEISNFSKEGKQSLHNLNYWNMGSYAGIGPSAASTLMTSDGPVRIENKRSISAFLNEESFDSRVDFEYLKPDSFLLEHLMMGFRLIDGIDKEHINSVFKVNIENYLEPVLERWQGKLKIKKKSIYLTEEGLSLLNPFLVDTASLGNSNPINISGKEINWPL